MTFQHSTCVTQPFNLFVMPPKTKKGPTSKPQSLSVPKQAQKPSLKVIESATINSSDEEDPNSQLQSTKVHCISWTTARTKQPILFNKITHLNTLFYDLNYNNIMAFAFQLSIQTLDWLEENPVD